MARQRLNKQFLLILTTVVLAGLLVALVAPRFLKAGNRDTAKLTKEGDEAMEKRDWIVAKEKYSQALSGDPNNTGVLVKIGDALVKLTPNNPEFLEVAHLQWNKAISIDPGNKEALSKLLDSYWEYLEFMPRADLFEKSRDLADKLLVADPSNKTSLLRKHIATVRQFLTTKTAPSEKVAESMEQLQALAKADPANPDLPTYYALARANQGQTTAENQGAGASHRLFDEAAAVIEAARLAQPDNAAMQYRAYQVYRELQRTDPRTKEARSTDSRYTKATSEAIVAAQKASSMMRPDDVLYDDIQWAAAGRVEQDAGTERAKELVNAYYKSRPDNQKARLLYAKMLAFSKTPADRDEAKRILSQDVVAGEDTGGYRALLLRELQAQTFAELALMQVQDLSAAAADPAKRAEASRVLDDTMDKLRRIKSPRTLLVLALEGRIHLVRGQDVEAVKALEEARALLPVNQPDNDLLFLLARACVQTRQPGRAKDILLEVVASAPTAIGPRAMLAELYLQENDTGAAKAQVEAIRKVKADAPEVARLEEALQLAAYKSDPAGAVDAFRKMPERTREERLRKAAIGARLEQFDEVKRVLDFSVAQDPKDAESARALVGLLIMRDRKDEARAALEAALRTSPQDRWLLDAKRDLDGAAPPTGAAAIEDANKIADPFERALKKYQLASRPDGSPAVALGHLEEAHKLRPGETRVLDALFRHHCGQRRFDLAKPYLDRLVELNADQCGGLLLRQQYALMKGDLAGAEALGQQLTREYAEFAQSWFAMAQAQRARGKFEDAAKSLVEVRKRQPTHPEATPALIDCYYQVNKLEEAKGALRDARKVFPENVKFREMFLNHIVNFEDPANAIPERERLLKEGKNAEDPSHHLALAATYFHAAQREAATKRDLSSQHLRQAFQTLLVGRDRFPDDGRFYSQIAEMLQYDGKVADAEKLLREFAQRPAVRDKPDPYLALADLYGRISQTEKARTALSDALAKAPRDMNIRLRLAAILTQLKQYGEASVVLGGVSPADRDDYRVFRQGVEVQIASGDLKAAEAALRSMLEKRDTTDLRNLLASILIDTNRVPEALTHINKAIEADSRNDATRYLYALALAKGAPPDITGAIAELAQLRDRSPRNMQVRLLLAELWDRTGQLDNATRTLEEALASTPLNRDVRQNLIRLYRKPATPKFDLAMRHCEAAMNDPVMRADPTWPREMAITYAAQKQPERAVMLMDKAIAMAPTNLDYRREMLDMLLQFDQSASALIESDKLLKANIDAWWVRHQRGLAIAKMKDPTKPDEDAKRNAAALAEFDKALAFADAAKDPNVAEFILRGLSTVVTETRVTDSASRRLIPVGFDAAIARIQPRLADDPERRWSLLNVAMLRGKADFAAALTQVGALLASSQGGDPRVRASVLRAAADVYQNAPKPDYAKSIESYKELLTLAPDDLTSLNNLAYLLAEPPPGAGTPRPQEAKKYSGIAYAQVRFGQPAYEQIADTHGWVLTLCGGDDAVQGLKILEDLVGVADGFLEGRYHLGESYLRQEPPKKDKARNKLARAMTIIKELENGGSSVDPGLKDKIQKTLAKAQS